MRNYIRGHVGDLPFKHYLMLHRPTPSQRKKLRSKAVRDAYREYKFLIETLNEEKSYSHDVAELYSRLEELHRRTPNTQKKLLLQSSRLLHPKEFLRALALLVGLGLIRVTICRFGQDKIIPGEYEGNYHSIHGWEEPFRGHTHDEKGG